MSTDVNFVIVQKEPGIVVVDGYVGGKTTYDLIREVRINKTPDVDNDYCLIYRVGWEQAHYVCSESNYGGMSGEVIRELQKLYGDTSKYTIQFSIS